MLYPEIDRDIPADKLKQIKEFIEAHRSDYERTHAASDWYYWNEGETYVTSFTTLLKDGMEGAFRQLSMQQTHYNQILSWFDVFPKGEDPYESFLDRLEERHGPLKGKHIVEIGGGPVPVLARRMRERMLDENGNMIGTITVYDPDLIVETEGVKCIRAKFDEDKTEVPADTFMVGMLSCEGTMAIVTSIETRNLQGMIKLCSCWECQDKVNKFRKLTEFKGKPVRMVYAYAHNDYNGQDEPILTTESGRSR